MSAGHCHIIRNLTPPHLSKNEPSLPGLGDADVARSRRRRVISTVEPDEPASNFQQCDNGRVIACCQLSSAVPCSESQPSQRFLVSLALRGCRGCCRQDSPQAVLTARRGLFLPRSLYVIIQF